MTRSLFLAALALGALFAFSSPSPVSAEDDDTTFDGHLLPFLETYCLKCHSGEEKKAGLGLDAYTTQDSVIRDRKTWEKVIEMLLEHEMPPERQRQPPEDLRQRIAAWIRAELDRFDCSGPVDPGRVTIRRLNRAEYRNTIRDLLGVDYAAVMDFPADEVGYGFDNIGDVLALPPLLMEKYLDAAEEIVDLAVAREHSLAPRTRYEAESLPVSERASSRGIGIWGRSIDQEGEMYFTHDFPHTGDYVIRARAYGEQAGPEKVRMAFRADGSDAGVVTVAAEEDRLETYEVRARIEAGKRRVAVAYLNNYINNRSPDPALRGDRNLVLDWIEVEAVADTRARTSPALERIFECLPDEPTREAIEPCARQILERFASRAFRRPARPEEVDALVRLALDSFAAGDTFEEGVKTALQAVLVSPRFLFRVELDSGDGAGAAQPIGQFDLASRLSYFLWSSMPDDELFDLAAAGRLQEDEVLDAQVRRMLADPRSKAFVENFASQWLQTRLLERMSPDPTTYPDFDEDLRRDMETETLMFFEAVLREDRSVLDFVDGDFTFVNERLARHYGIDGVDGREFRRVSLADSARGGILTHASILTLTSNPTRTSPVKRGKWVLEQIMGTPPPPPIPDAPPLSEEPEAILSGSLRQRMEKHREDPICASCHARMDPIGFAFENFDGIGKWRDFDGPFTIDPSGTLPDGRSFDGPDGLKVILRSETDLFGRNLAEKVLTFALGRGIEYYDRCAVDDVVAALEKNDYRISSMILAIARSDPFRMRRGG